VCCCRGAPPQSGQLVGIGQSPASSFFHLNYRDLRHAAAAEGPPQLARLTPNVIGTAQYAAPELMNEDLLEVMKPDQRYLQVRIANMIICSVLQ